MTSTPERLFVSLALPDPCRALVSELYDSLEGVTWTRPEQLHLTMRFLGDVDSDLAARIETSLAKIRVKSFLLPLEGVGRLPPRGSAKVLSVGIGRANTLLFQLRQKIDDALLSAGWRGELRNFNPHITVGRVLDTPQEAIDHWLYHHQEFVGPLFRVGSFQLMQSTLQPAGAVHTLRRDFALVVD
ncbi:MAG: RNA 2',3'-cyclic phosphodiesterase [Verrucomicrobia bacterium]|nr:RNA 2',3'-cyclic phosphodiesterase [Verrucomicrobiota bacterium]